MSAARFWLILAAVVGSRLMTPGQAFTLSAVLAGFGIASIVLHYLLKDPQ